MKKIAMTAAVPRVAAPIEEWVQTRLGQDDEKPIGAVRASAPPEPTIRLTLDIPKGMHKRLKLGATEREKTIADVIRELIEREFPSP
jgi:hypothetical protein